MIENGESVSSYFGYWPDFCDGEIQSFSYKSSGVIELCIFYIDANLNKSAHVALEFNGISDVALNNLFSTNVIDKISIIGNEPFIVSIESCYGLGGEFKCKSIKVINMPNPSFKRDA